VIFRGAAWPTYSLWQFFSEILPQLPVKWTRSDMDVVYNGTIEELKARCR